MTQPPPVPVLGYQGSGNPDGWQRVRRIAKAQRLLLWAVLISLLFIAPAQILQFAAPTLPLAVVAVVALGLVLVAGVIRAIATFQLSLALGYHLALTILLLILSFAPCLGLIVLLVVNQQATNALRRAGLTVGLMGAKCPDNPPADWTG
jgi:hypothetical protein